MARAPRIWPVLIVCLVAVRVSAEVRPLDIRGFAFEVETTVAGTPEAAFDGFARDTLSWWDHHFSERPKRLSFEPRPGGGFVEIFDDAGNGARHATVIYADRGKVLRFEGPLGLSGQAVHVVYDLRFAAIEGGTRLKLAVRGMGEIDEKTVALVESVWRHFLVERFKPYMDGKAGR